ncbi:MAG TPA: ATP-binding protein [Azospirillaceae bacterium]|nr:ATP-binding protein [Azospirillaceae bacterium]
MDSALIQESEARYRALLECSTDWLWETDIEGRLTALSVRAKETAVRTAENFLGLTFADLLDTTTPVEDYPLLAEALVRRKAFRRLSFPLRAPDGTGRWVMISGLPRFVGNGRFVGHCGTATDITDARRAAEIAHHRQTMAALGSLVGGLTHELNNLIQPIIGLADLSLRRVEDGSRLATSLASIRDSGVKARAILRDVLSFARTDVINSDSGDVASIVETALSLARPLLPATVAVQTDLADGLPSVGLGGTELTQVILNLARNAGHAMPDGGTLTVAGRRVMLEVAETAALGMKPGGYVRVIVADTGIGMDEKTRRRAFDPFFTTRPVGQGTGLGLSVVYGLVNNAGGRIALDSTPGRGTVFTIDLPDAAFTIL